MSHGEAVFVFQSLGILLVLSTEESHNGIPTICLPTPTPAAALQAGQSNRAAWTRPPRGPSG
eukprot:3964391-Pyramimonas_sp.AAC.1